jgi:Skp family chaperone for outer membrane proteins
VSSRTESVLKQAAVCLLPFALSLSVVAAEKTQKLAVVNVSFVFEKYDKVSDIQRRLDEMYKVRRTELTKRGQELLRRGQELEQQYPAGPTTETAYDEIQKLRREQFMFERDAGQLSTEIDEAYAKEMREVLTDIRMAIKQIGEERRFDMVLRSPSTDDPVVEEVDPRKPPDPAALDKKTHLELIEPRNVSELLERFYRNPVLYGAAPTDITPEVLSRLNAAYAKRTGKAPVK